MSDKRLAILPPDTLRIAIFRDGDAWCAAFSESFEDLQTPPAGFGENVPEAVNNLLIESSNCGLLSDDGTLTPWPKTL